MDILDEGPSPQPVVTGAEMSVSGNNTNGTLLMKPKDRLMGKNRLVLHSILTNMMKWNRYLHILQFLHFTDNRDGHDTKEGNCDRLREIQDIFEILNRKFSKFHNPSENMATDEVIVLFRGMIYSENIFPKSTKVFVSNYTTG
jgi:hypothetical protein